MNWIKSLLSSDELGADSVAVGGLASILSMTVLTSYVVLFHGAPFNPTEYAMAAGGLLAAIAGSKRLRDGTPDGGK